MAPPNPEPERDRPRTSQEKALAKLAIKRAKPPRAIPPCPPRLGLDRSAEGIPERRGR